MNVEHARTLHRDALILDAHTDTLQRVLVDNADLGVRSEADPLVERADLPRYREGGVNAQIFAVWVDTIYLPNHGVRRAMQQIDAFHRVLDKHPDQVSLAVPAQTSGASPVKADSPRCSRSKGETRFRATWECSGCSTDWAPHR